MPRRARVNKRRTLPDARYNSPLVAIFINRLMVRGQKNTAEGIVYDALDILEQQEHKSGLSVLEQAFKNATPLLQVKPRRVGGATYQVPVEVPQARGLSLAMRWILQASRARTGKSMAERLASELADASKGTGTTIKKREDTHKMAEANRAFAHYRW
ncbi:MAG: 30S ribosomal protein S7 [Dehalococcoidia bacterium]|jgi:small subunit ribosomal protein S7|nr:MAG: 30S ribosomal protein S7 [Dehalococcoidia bacterium]